MVEDNLPLVGYIVKKFKPKTLEERRDFVQQGTIALIDAVKRFDEKRGKLSTIIHCCVYKAVNKYLKKQFKSNKKVKFYASVVERFAYDNNRIWEYYVSSLSNLEKDIVKLRIEGFTFRAIEEKYAKNRNWANKIYYRALLKIKEGIANNNGN